MKKLNIFILLFITSYLFFLSSTFALETDTHENINGFIIENNLYDFSLDFYLQKQLGITNGISEEFSSDETKTVLEWIKKGGKYEDKPTDGTIPYLRSTNHFHDPLSNKGFSGLIFGLLFNGDSSIKWSQKPIVTQYPGGYYSWFDTRDYFYKALTSITKSDRDKYFAETFRGLGQLMHLVQDISVPAHSRDQFHVGYDYEGFILNYQNEVLEEYAGKFESLLENPISFDQSLLTSISTLAPIPFANIFDSEKYTVANPDYLITLNNNIGLSEYANANFFSDRTIFLGYPHPAKENTDALLIEQIAEDGETDKLYYIQGYQSERLALYSYFANLDISGNPEGWKYTLDDAVHEDYAQKLIPRAVGYSAGLLNYFFRGNIEAVNLNSTNDVSGNVTGMKLKVKNLTPDEAMESGILVISYQYKPVGSSAFVYGTSNEFSLNEPINSGSESLSEYSFYFNNPIPSNAQEVKYLLVFKGKLGNEDGAVVGKMLELKKFYGGLFEFYSGYNPELEYSFGYWKKLNTETFAAIYTTRNFYEDMLYIKNESGYPIDKYLVYAGIIDPPYINSPSLAIRKWTLDQNVQWINDLIMEWPMEGGHTIEPSASVMDEDYVYSLTIYENAVFVGPGIRKNSKTNGSLIANCPVDSCLLFGQWNYTDYIVADDKYIYIVVNSTYENGDYQSHLVIKSKSDLSTVNVISSGFSNYFDLPLVDDDYLYIIIGSFIYRYDKTNWQLVDSFGISEGYLIFSLTHDDKYFYAIGYTDNNEAFHIKMDKSSREITVYPIGIGLEYIDNIRFINNYEYYVSCGLRNKGYKFEYKIE